MDIGTTAPVSGTSPTTPHAQLPSSTQQQAAQPTQPPGIGIRSPQSNILALPASGMPAVPDSAPQYISRPAADSPRSRLCAAARDGDCNAIKRMIQAGNGNLNTIDPATGMTALMLAAQHGHDDVVQLLCKDASAIDIHRPNAHGDTALILAARGGHFDIVQRLLVKGAQADKRNAGGESALSAAERAGRREVVQLLKALPISATVETTSAFSAYAMGESELLHAASGGDLARVQELLAAGADANEADDGGWTPLFNAAHNGHTALVKLLLSHGARINHLNHNGETALMLAAGAGQLAAMQALIDAGADALLFNQEGKTASRMARDIGQDLLANELDSIVAEYGSTSMTSATTAGATTAISTISSSASFAAPDRKAADNSVGIARWPKAFEHEDMQTLKRLPTGKDAGGSIKSHALTPLLLAAREGDTAAVEALLKAATLLEAVERNDAQALKRLLAELRQSGKNVVYEVNRLGKLENPDDSLMKNRKVTPLMVAAYFGYEQLLALLVEAGARVDFSRRDGWTALLFAADQGHTGALQALLQAGAKVDHAKSNGTTAMMLAVHNNHTATVQALLQAGANPALMSKDG